MRRAPRPKIIFITGTDTGVGKTVLTSLLLSHLRHKNGVVLAIKPFCSGSRRDAEILLALQSGELAINEINPFYFPEPVAPLISERKNRREISLGDALNSIRKIVKKLQKTGISSATVNDSQGPIPILLIEGAGGLLVPLGEGFTTLELIKALGCEVVVVARNRLGTINHTLLTIQALQRARKMKRKPGFSSAQNQDVRMKVVLMGSNHPDISGQSNQAVLAEFLAPVPIIPIPFLGKKPLKMAEIATLSKKLKKTLARILV